VRPGARPDPSSWDLPNPSGSALIELEVRNQGELASSRAAPPCACSPNGLSRGRVDISHSWLGPDSQGEASRPDPPNPLRADQSFGYRGLSSNGGVHRSSWASSRQMRRQYGTTTWPRAAGRRPWPTGMALIWRASRR